MMMIIMLTIMKLRSTVVTLERLRFTFTTYGKRQTSVENFSE